MPTSGTGPFWSVILPAERTNLIVNPSFEFGTANWTTLGASSLGSVSGTSVAGAWGMRINGQGAGSLGNDRGAVYGTANGLDTNGTYYLSAYVYTTGGTVALYAGTDNTVAGGNYAIASGTQSGWFRLVTPRFRPTGGSVFPKVVAYGTAMTGTIYVDAVQLEKGTVESTYIDGDQIDCSWDGLQHASTSKRGRDTRTGGVAVRLDDLGFTVDTSPGIGAPPFTTVSQSYAQLDGGEFQRQRKGERRFTLTSLVDGTSWADLHYQRRRLIEALRIENTPSQQPLRLLYAGAGGTVAIDAVWDGGVQFGADGQSFAEGIVASFTAYDPDWQDQLQQGTTLADQRVFSSLQALIYRDPMGYWDNIATPGIGAALIENAAIYAIAESLDGGTIYAGVNSIWLQDGITRTRGIGYFAGTTWGTIGNGTISGYVRDMQWDFDRSRLLISGNLGTAAGTPTGQLAFWNPTTNQFGSVGFIGTGTRFVTPQLNNPDPVINAMLLWSPGTYYLAGHFHRINGNLLGSNWNILRWNGQLNGWSAAPPVSVNGTGFIYFDQVVDVGSAPAEAWSLTRFDQTRMLVGAHANRLRGFGDGHNVALYDVRGTWGTVPGFRVPINTDRPFGGDGYRAPDRSVYFAYTGTSTIGTTALKIQGLTANNVGTIDSTFTYAWGADPDTVAWLGGFDMDINNVTPALAIVRTNGYDYQPADAIINGVCSAIYVANDGTTYFGMEQLSTTEGTAASLGTIRNTGMSNVYPTLRLRNTSTTGTAIVRQWANMTTKEYAWFALSLLPGETATLTTGPGRVAFQSTYRGDILSTVVGGSKLASWKLLPGENIVSFLADSTAVVADMFWNPRHHSADGTGIV